MELPFKFIDILYKISNEPGILVAFAAFHPFTFVVLIPFFWILKKLGIYAPKRDIGLFGLGVTFIVAMGWLMGFVSQILLLFMGISGIKMVFIYISMYLCITAFVVTNLQALKKQFNSYEAKKKSIN